ncbi:MAG: rhamnulokinase [Prevotella sp.]|nr:rhamnulokinase [Prevotella sp.]
MNAKHYLAIDLGATSGRSILGTLSDGRLQTEEITRFPNRLITTAHHTYWDILALYGEILRALTEVARRGIEIQSMGIDTWGVDFVLVGDDDELLRAPMAYRDPCTFPAMDDYLNNKLSQRDLYEINGLQLMNFNSIFQIYALSQERNSALAAAKHLLFMPDALAWMLTGRMVCEYTIASTSGLLDVRNQKMSRELLATAGISEEMIPEMVMPGDEIGTLAPHVQRLTGIGPVKVVAVAGHDTASAVAAVPAKKEGFAYLSSGTWSLMGIETKAPIVSDKSFERNFTNEGGICGTIRFLKNICGMWMLERCRAEWTDAPTDYNTLFDAAMACPPAKALLNPDDPMFANPESMTAAIAEYFDKHGQPAPQGWAETTRCLFESLAHRYAEVAGYLQEFSDVKLDTLHVIGGGSQNDYLNQMTADATGLTVIAGPAEGTAMGNIMVQATLADHTVGDIWEMRQIIANSITLKTFYPKS